MRFSNFSSILDFSIGSLGNGSYGKSQLGLGICVWPIKKIGSNKVPGRDLITPISKTCKIKLRPPRPHFNVENASFGVFGAG